MKTGLRFFSLLCCLAIILLSVPAVGATGNSSSVILADEYYSINLLDGASNFACNGVPCDALGVLGVAGADIDYTFDLAMATYVDYIVVDYYCDFATVPSTVSAQPFQGNFVSASPVSRGDGLYQATIPFSGIIPAGLTIRFSFGGIVYTQINIQSVVGYISDTVVDDNAVRIDYRPYVETNTSTDWSTLTNQTLPWSKTFTGYRDPMADYANTLRSGIDLNVCFDLIPVRWASKVVFSFSFPYRFVEDPDTHEWHTSDEMFEFGIYIDKTQSASGSYYPDVTYTKSLEYADNSVGDFAPWMVYTFTVDLHECDLSYSKFYFACRFYGFGVAGATTTSDPVTTECTLSPATYYVEPAPSNTWLASLLNSISRGFNSVVDALTDLFSSDAVQDSADNLHDSMQQVDDFVGGHQQVVDQYVPQIVFDANDVIYSNATAFGFIGSVLSEFASKMHGLDVVLTLPLVLGLFFAICQRVAGSTSFRGSGGSGGNSYKGSSKKTSTSSLDDGGGYSVYY